MCCCKQGKTLVTACAPLCGLRAIRKVTSHCSSQTQPCQKRVVGVRHLVNSAQPKVAGEPRGRKMCRIKAGGRLCAPRPATPPRRAGRGFSIGGRNFHFLLWQVAVNEENRGKTVSFHHFKRWLSQVVFRDFAEISAGVIFHPLGSNRGLVFPLLLQPPRYCRFQAGICAEFDVQNPKRSANIFWTIFDGLYPFLLCFICFPALFETSVSTCSTSVCGCLCGQTPLQHLFRIGIASV